MSQLTAITALSVPAIIKWKVNAASPSPRPSEELANSANRFQLAATGWQATRGRYAFKSRKTHLTPSAFELKLELSRSDICIRYRSDIWKTKNSDYDRLDPLFSAIGIVDCALYSNTAGGDTALSNYYSLLDYYYLKQPFLTLHTNLVATVCIGFTSVSADI